MMDEDGQGERKERNDMNDHQMTLDEYLNSKNRYAWNEKLLMKQWNGT